MSYEQTSDERRDASTVIDERLAYLEERAEHNQLTEDEWHSLTVLRRIKKRNK